MAQKKREKLKTLNGRLPLEDSSDFYDFCTELILTTRSIIWDILHLSQFFSVSGGRRTVVGWSLDGHRMVVGRLLSHENFYLQNSKFNWPGLGPRRAAPSVRAVPPQPWPIEILKFTFQRSIYRSNDRSIDNRRSTNRFSHFLWSQTVAPQVQTVLTGPTAVRL